MPEVREPARAPSIRASVGACALAGAASAVIPAVAFFHRNGLQRYADFLLLVLYFSLGLAIFSILLCAPVAIALRRRAGVLGVLPFIAAGVLSILCPVGAILSEAFLKVRFGLPLAWESHLAQIGFWLAVAGAVAGGGALIRLAWLRGPKSRAALLFAGLAALHGAYLAVRNPAWEDPGEFRPSLDRYPEPVATRPARKILAICIDGANWEMLEPLLESGRLPHLGGILRNGIRADMHGIHPFSSHESWATIFTGKNSDRHGIKGHMVVGFPGVSLFRLDYHDRDNLPLVGLGAAFAAAGMVELYPVPSTFLRVKPLWKVLSDHGRSVWVLGMPSSWPALPVNGAMLTDRVYHSVWEIGFRHRDRIPGGTHPEGLREKIADKIYDPAVAPLDDLTRFFPATEEDIRAARRPPGLLFHDRRALFLRTYAMDQTVLDSFDVLASDGALPDLAVLYLTGIDTACHHFYQHLFPGHYPPGFSPTEEVERFKEVIPRYWEYLDGRLGRVLNLYGDDATVLVLSDHGNHPFPRHPIFPTWHDRDGIFILRGPGLRKGARAEPLTLLDVAPLLYLESGFPVPRDLDGSLRADLYETPPEVRRISSYDP